MADISSIILPNGSTYTIKDAEGRTTAATCAVKSTFLVVEKKSKNNVSISSNASINSDFTITKSGYTPIGILGFILEQGSDGSTEALRYEFCHQTRWYISGTPPDNARITIRNICTVGGAKPNVHLYILYAKTG